MNMEILDISKIAQTNLQLYDQMRTGGYSDAQVEQVVEAYSFATRLFANRFRAEGKPFCAHLVGTASVMVALNSELPVIIGALLHAAYQEGDFGAMREGMTETKQEVVREIIGLEAEAWVAAYTLGSRSTAGLKATYARFDELNANEKLLLEMQLANELDDYRDQAALYAKNSELRIKKIAETWEIQVKMAEQLGHYALANLLREIYQSTLENTPSDRLRSSHGDGYELVPTSCRLRISVRIFRLGTRARRWLSRSLTKTEGRPGR